MLSQHVRLLQKKAQSSRGQGRAVWALPPVAARTAIDRYVLASKAVQWVLATGWTLYQDQGCLCMFKCTCYSSCCSSDWDPGHQPKTLDMCSFSHVERPADAPHCHQSAWFDPANAHPRAARVQEGPAETPLSRPAPAGPWTYCGQHSLARGLLRCCFAPATAQCSRGLLQLPHLVQLLLILRLVLSACAGWLTVEVQQGPAIKAVNEVVLLAIPRDHARLALNRGIVLIAPSDGARSAVDADEVDGLLALQGKCDSQQGGVLGLAFLLALHPLLVT